MHDRFSPLMTKSTTKATQSDHKVTHTLLALLVFLNIVGLCYYLFYTYKYQFHSDSAAANLLAQEIYETRQYFPRDWNYANGDLWVVLMQTWILPMIPFFKNGYGLHAAGAVIGCILMGIATWSICGILALPTRAKLFAIALLSAGFTPVMSEHIYGQQAYGTTYYTAGILLVSCWKYMHAKDRARWIWALSCGLLFILVAWANPQRAMIYFVLPVLGGLAAMRRTVRGPHYLHMRQWTSLLTIAAIFTLIGAFLHHNTVANNLSGDGPIIINWLDFAGMANNASRVINGLVAVVGGMPTSGTPVATIGGIVDALRLVAGVAIVLVTPYAVIKFLRSSHPGRAFIAGSAVASIATSLFILLTTTLSVDGAPDQSVRYLVPGMLLSLLLVVAFVTVEHNSGLAKRFAAAAGLGVLVLSAPIAFGIIQTPSPVSPDAERAVPALRLIHFLESEGLHYGYATFWHANQTTVLSDGIVKIRQIQFADGMPTPMRHLSSNRWYDPGTWQGPTFLLLAKEDARDIHLAAVFDQVGAPVRRLEFEGMQIFVFSHNLALDFPTWEVHITDRLQYRATANTPHMIGHFDSAKRALIAEQGETGTLRFGPYQRLDKGRYSVTFDIEAAADKSGEFGNVDVKDRTRLLGSHAIDRPGKQRITIPIVLDNVTNGIEFRVLTSGTCKISVFNVELVNNDRTK